MDTSGLLARARSGDADAWARLLELSYPELRRAVGTRFPTPLRPLLDDDDVLHSALVRASGKLDRFTYRGKGSFVSWLARICERVARDEMRQRNRRPQQAPSGHEPMTESRSPSRAAVHGEELAQLVRALDTLQGDERELLIEHELIGVDAKQLADARGVSSEAIRLRLYRAKHKLARWFEVNH